MQKNNKNQYVNYYSWLSYLLILAFIFVSLKPLFGGEKGELYKQSYQRAEGLAYQLLQIYSEHQKYSSSLNTGSDNISENRAPSSDANVADWSQWQSEGEIGKDPWGDPYNYRLVMSDAGTLQFIQVWSKNNPEKVLLKVK